MAAPCAFISCDSNSAVHLSSLIPRQLILQPSVLLPVFWEEVISLNGVLQQVPLKGVQLKQVMLIMRSASHIREPCGTKVKHVHTRAHTNTHALFVFGTMVLKLSGRHEGLWSRPDPWRAIPALWNPSSTPSRYPCSGKLLPLRLPSLRE